VLQAQAIQTCEERGHFYFAISGGSMLQMLSNLAVNPAMESMVPWGSCTMAFVSHRAVPLDDQGATFHKAKHLFLQSWIDAGLKVLADIRSRFGVPVLTDVHEDTPLAEVAAVVDVLQTPAFLCRQTNFIVAVASQGKPVNIKKGQFLSPWEMQNVVDKARSTGNEQIMVCERGFSFGYNNLVSDMRSLAVMRRTGCPVVFDATHSVQLPGGQGSASGGQREFVPVLARAAVAAGVAGVFMETHPDPARALSDGPNAWPLDRMSTLLETLVGLDRVAKSRPFEEDQL